MHLLQTVEFPFSTLFSIAYYVGKSTCTGGSVSLFPLVSFFLWKGVRAVIELTFKPLTYLSEVIYLTGGLGVSWAHSVQPLVLFFLWEPTSVRMYTFFSEPPRCEF